MTWQAEQIQVVPLERGVLRHLIASGTGAIWAAVPHLDAPSALWLLPLVGTRPLRLITLAHPGEADLPGLALLRDLPDCEVRTLPRLHASTWAVEGGQALLSSGALNGEGLESGEHLATLLPSAETTLDHFGAWWERAHPLDQAAWSHLALATAAMQEAGRVGQEIRHLGGFVKLSVRGTKRSRRIDPREFGVSRPTGRAIRPVEVAFYKLDEVIKAREELEAILADRGLEWNGHYLLSRSFLEGEWPLLFASKEAQLRERLQSPEGRASFKAQIDRARQELTEYFTELRPEVADADELWVELQVDRILAEAISDSVLEESGLEYRLLTILPEDSKSVAELAELLQHPKLRSVQLTFHF
ncbi:MAG TPA: hypothetical protein VK191_01220 [Symbiobacteriaceae bacterium]|nr:hypothetical protein [Symbiobacteriaceae bacterium]